jgi:hypothetical protein
VEGQTHSRSSRWPRRGVASLRPPGSAVADDVAPVLHRAARE